jgi:hypothetical protein
MITKMPWPTGCATGIGSLPGKDPIEALRIVLGELPDFPHLPELPARGPGSDIVGRAAAILVDMPVELQPSGWRLSDHPGRDLRGAAEHLSRDLDALQTLTLEYEGSFKIQVSGPWTLASQVEVPSGNKALSDLGATRDLAESLVEGLTIQVAEVRHRLPGAEMIVQIDEPMLSEVLAGKVPTASGFGTLPAIEDELARRLLKAMLEAAQTFTIVHCCSPRAPIRLLAEAGANALSLDASTLTELDDEPLAESLEAGLGLLFGVVPGVETKLSDPTRTVSRVRDRWRRLGLAPDLLAARVVLTPSCGLAKASPAYARSALAHVREAARRLGSDPER